MSNYTTSLYGGEPVDCSDSDGDDFMKSLAHARYNRSSAYDYTNASASDLDSEGDFFPTPSSSDPTGPPPPPPPVDDYDFSDSDDDFGQEEKRTSTKSNAKLLSPTNRNGGFNFGNAPSPSNGLNASRINERVQSMYPSASSTSSTKQKESKAAPPAFHTDVYMQSLLPSNNSDPPPPPSADDDEDDLPALVTNSKKKPKAPTSPVPQYNAPVETRSASSSISTTSQPSGTIRTTVASTLENESSTIRSFSNSMSNNFDVAYHQVEAGLYLVKRMIAFVRKLVQLEEDRYKSIQKMLHHELTKAEKIGLDGMAGIVQVFKSTKQYFGEISEQHKNIAEAVTLKVLHPLMEFYEKNDARLRDIINEEHRLSKEMATARSVVTKYQKECLKLHATIRNVQEEKAAAAAPVLDHEKKSFFSKVKQQIKVSLVDPKRLTEQLAIQAKLYMDAVRSANERQQKYITKDLVKIFDGLEQIEVQRISVVKDRLHKLHKIYVKVQSPIKEIVDSMEGVTGPLRHDEEIKSYLDNYIYIHGEPTSLHGFNYLLPCTPEDLMNGKIEGTPNSVFKTTLQHIMSMQKEEYPQYDVPRILNILITSVKELGGFKTEGIFRVSHQKDELAIMRKSFDTGECKICTTSPHGPAALMKEWLRDLSEALVPSELYADSVRICKTASMTEEDSVLREKTLEIYKRLDDVNKAVIRDIAVMCANISSPENQKVNRMTMDNIAIVFSPSFLRNPSEDPMELLNNTKHEIRFTSLFLSAVAEYAGGDCNEDHFGASLGSATSTNTIGPVTSTPISPASSMSSSSPNSPGNAHSALMASISFTNGSNSSFNRGEDAFSGSALNTSSSSFPPPAPQNNSFISSGPSSAANSMPPTPSGGSSFFTPAPSSSSNSFLTSHAGPSSPAVSSQIPPSSPQTNYTTSNPITPGTPQTQVMSCSIPMRGTPSAPILPARPTSFSVSRPPPAPPGFTSSGSVPPPGPPGPPGPPSIPGSSSNF